MFEFYKTGLWRKEWRWRWIHPRNKNIVFAATESYKNLSDAEHARDLAMSSFRSVSVYLSDPSF